MPWRSDRCDDPSYSTVASRADLLVSFRARYPPKRKSIETQYSPLSSTICFHVRRSLFKNKKRANTVSPKPTRRVDIVFAELSRRF